MPSTLTPEEIGFVEGLSSLKKLAESMALPAGARGCRVSWRDNTKSRVWGVFTRPDANRMVNAILAHCCESFPGGGVAYAADVSGFSVIWSHPKWPGDDTVITATKVPLW